MLQQMLASQPSDPFLYYALAIEYDNRNEKQKADEQYLFLSEHFPDYLPLYYQYATFLLETMRLDEAMVMVSKGVLLAEQQKEMKTLRELTQLRSVIEDEMD